MASGDTLLILTAQAATPPATTFATFDVLVGAATPTETVPVLDFDDTTDEHADFICELPRNYAGGGLTCVLKYAAAAATGNVKLDLAIRRVADDAEDIDTTAHSYDYNTVTATVASAIGEVDYATITFADGADMDSLAVGELFILRVRRDADNVADTLVGDAMLISIEIRET